jgi:transient receptor potential cation channel subfamily C protein 4
MTVVIVQAIHEGVYRIVELLVNHPSITREVLGSEWSRYRRSAACLQQLHSDDESSDYPPDISPIILAAHCNQFEILQLLLSRGARIERPHHLSCGCRRCAVERQRDSLRYSLLRIHTYEVGVYCSLARKEYT